MVQKEGFNAMPKLATGKFIKSYKNAQDKVKCAEVNITNLLVKIMCGNLDQIWVGQGELYCKLIHNCMFMEH